eukprot:CAMPEP_0202707604 /NCGR_PEP_ID=MMETSP1385-20130828/19904_1 /ASSEMBLY_ACC=CAM_ASM_000861 /TAXON_ID=933848 /ORGANISM="Elphidium margaritaceum" /LENGTH=463 /DNA_ID=CAMNT_0049366351 /DNA_START=1017 /DNA_END=2408 /DNA_ORIENTATION=+
MWHKLRSPRPLFSDSLSLCQKSSVWTTSGPLPILNQTLVDKQISPSIGVNQLQTELLNKGKKVSKLGFGASPWPVPKCVEDRLRENTDKRWYLPVRGLPELREAVAKVYSKQTGNDYTAEDVSVSPGSKENLFILQLAYNADLVLPAPSWVSYAPQAHVIGRRVKWIETEKENGYKLSAERLEQEVHQYPDRPRILIVNTPNNPTGMVYTNDELKELASVCRQHRILCVSDEIYGPLTFDGVPHVSIAQYYPEGTIILNGISKWCGAGGYRLGFFIFPPNLRWLQQAMDVIASETFSSTSAPIQYAACAAFENYFGDEMQTYLKVSRTVLNGLAYQGYNILSQVNGCHVNRPNGAFYIFPDFTNVPGLKNICPTGDIFERWLLFHAGVSGLSGYCFGRSLQELSMKFSYVDFDGKSIFADLENLPKDVESPEMEQYLRKHCGNVMRGYEQVRDSLNNLPNLFM